MMQLVDYGSDIELSDTSAYKSNSDESEVQIVDPLLSPPSQPSSPPSEEDITTTKPEPPGPTMQSSAGNDRIWYKKELSKDG